MELLPSFLQQHPRVRLVVIDSITFHFRQDFADMAARTRQLAQMAQALMQLAGRQEVAVSDCIFSCLAIASSCSRPLLLLAAWN